MKTKLNPALVGMFVLGAFGLIVLALLSFRSAHFFSKPGRFVAYFSESVQGLDVGSAVKLRGVRVGRVVAIRVRYDAHTWPAPVAVVGFELYSPKLLLFDPQRGVAAGGYPATNQRPELEPHSPVYLGLTVF